MGISQIANNAKCNLRSAVLHLIARTKLLKCQGNVSKFWASLVAKNSRPFTSVYRNSLPFNLVIVVAGAVVALGIEPKCPFITTPDSCYLNQMREFEPYLY